MGVKNFYYEISPFLRGGKLRNDNIHIHEKEKNVFRIVSSFIIEPFSFLFLSLSPTHVVFVALSTLDDVFVDGMAWKHGRNLVIIPHQFTINTKTAKLSQYFNIERIIIWLGIIASEMSK